MMNQKSRNVSSTKLHSLRNKILILLIIPLILTNLPYISALKENNPIFPTTTRTERFHEEIDRGLVAYTTNDGDIYLSWRLLENDPDNIQFDVYRSDDGITSNKLNPYPISVTTDFLDESLGVTSNTRYWIVSLGTGLESQSSKKVGISNSPGNNYISIPLHGDYDVNSVGVGDLDGDGTYDYVIEYPHDMGTDPANGHWIPAQDTAKIDAYLSNGTYLWTYDMGWDIEIGSWYTPYVVYDLDGDGKSEVLVKSGDGDHRDLDGRVASGPEYLKILDGETGEEITRAPWISRWEENYSNLARNQLGIAYLDGINPYIIVARGTYGVLKAKAYFYEQGKLTEIWQWESDYEWGAKYVSQGAHMMTCHDVDDDGKEEVILGCCVLDEDGNGLWSTGFTHCDLAYLGDLDPSHPGLEIYYAIEGTGSIEIENGYGMSMVDAATGEFLWTINIPTTHMHGGIVSDITSDYDGMECYTSERDHSHEYLLSPRGNMIAQDLEFDYNWQLKAVYWDANLQRELLHGSTILNHNTQNIYTTQINGSVYGVTDIIGDWREEILTSGDNELRIYFTTIPAEDRRVCLMQDELYRGIVAHFSMGYRPIPTTSYCLATQSNESPTSEENSLDTLNAPTQYTKISAFYRAHQYVIKGYVISLVITGIIVFQGKNLIRFVKKWNKFERAIIKSSWKA